MLYREGKDLVRVETASGHTYWRPRGLSEASMVAWYRQRMADASALLTADLSAPVTDWLRAHVAECQQQIGARFGSVKV